MAHLAQFPNNLNVLYDLDTINFSDFDSITNGTDIYWCSVIDKHEEYFKKIEFDLSIEINVIF